MSSLERTIQRHILAAQPSAEPLRLRTRAVRRAIREGERTIHPAAPRPEMHAPDPTYRKPPRPRTKEQNAARRKRAAIVIPPPRRKLTRAERAAEKARKLAERLAAGGSR